MNRALLIIALALIISGLIATAIGYGMYITKL
jgi:hypothetical protein